MIPTYRLPDGSKMLASIAYSAGETRGVTMLVFVSWISLIAVTGLLSVIAVSAFNTRKSRDDNLFIRTHSASYFISLLLCNLVQAIASIMNTTWIQNQGVVVGPICTAQGTLTHAADVGITLWIMALSGYVFSHLFLQRDWKATSLWGTLVCGWSIIFGFILLGPATANVERAGPFYSISTYSCWISPHYKAGQVLLESLIMLLVVVLSSVSLILVFSQVRWNLFRMRRPCLDQSNEDEDWKEEAKTDGFSRQMQVYPIAYILLTLPSLLSQISVWSGGTVSFGASVFCSVIFLLSGPTNAILFLVLCPVLPPGSWRIGKQPLESAPDSNQDRGHRRTASDDTLVTASKKAKLRPPEIVITRDSIDSVYSVYEGEEDAPVVDPDAVRFEQVSRSAPARTYWSPESPRRQLPV